MGVRKLFQLLIPAPLSISAAQIVDNGPFQLRISSNVNASINGHAHPCADTLGLCYTQGAVPSARGSATGFFFTSYGAGDYGAGYLTYRNSSTYGPVGLIYDPGSNVAVPVFNQTANPETLGFDGETGDLLMTGIDDTTVNGTAAAAATTTTNGTDINPTAIPSSSSGGSGSGSGSSGANATTTTTTTDDRNYNNWFLCLVPLDQHTEYLVSWVLGANHGSPPTNPTCQAINITMETSAVGYGV